MSNYKTVNDLYGFIESLEQEDRHFYLVNTRFQNEIIKEKKLNLGPDNHYLNDLLEVQKACSKYQDKRSRSLRACNKEYRNFLGKLSSALLSEMVRLED